MNDEKWWFYFPSFIRGAFPWSIFFVVLAIKLFRNPDKTIHAPYPSPLSHRYAKIPLVWFGVGILALSCASGKRHSYLLPLFPAMSLFLASQFVTSPFSLSLKIRKCLSDVLSILLVFVFILCVLISEPAFSYYDVATHIMIGRERAQELFGSKVGNALPYFAAWFRAHVIQIEISLLTFFLMRTTLSLCKLGSTRNTQLANALTFWLTGLMSYAFIVFCAVGFKNSLKGFPSMAGGVNQIVPKNQSIVAIRYRYEELLDPLIYYLHRDVNIVEPPLSSLRCGTHYLTQIHHFPEVMELARDQKLNISIEGHFNEIMDNLSGNDERTILLFYCDCASSS